MRLFLQTNTYYPYGSAISSLSSGAPVVGSDYKFNGIEMVDDLGLNLHLADYRAYDALIGRWTGVDPKPNPSLSTYSGMGGNPIRYADPRGDTTYVYDVFGKYITTVKGSLPAQIHFVQNLPCTTENQLTIDKYEASLRKSSLGWISRRTMNELNNQINANYKEGTPNEHLLILEADSETREMHIIDITKGVDKFGANYRGPDFIVEVAAKSAINEYKSKNKQNIFFIVGHSHIENNYKKGKNDAIRPSYPNDESLGDWTPLNGTLHQPAFVVSKYGISLYTTGTTMGGHPAYLDGRGLSYDFFNSKLGKREPYNY